MTSSSTSIEELLLTADRLVAGDHLGATTVGRHRGASLALRTALELAVDRTLDAAVPGLGSSATRAKMLCLRCYAEAKTARRANAVWSHLCLGCHYHQYEIGPTHSQVRAWRAEVGELVQELTI
ncbi:hypothetical protein [Streptomyces sp. NBC_01477]|uniref:hypothetical protein n=1 Tax=Streptomyces sp. NBC_01477 TaxID=2976015 RepID=UPI002E3207AC|nr:hypothetical protein [Streptomyces sp. NBC_01477]